MIDWKASSDQDQRGRMSLEDVFIFLSRINVKHDSLHLLLDSSRPNAVAFVKVKKYNQGEIAQLCLSIMDVDVIDLICSTKRIDHLKQRLRAGECRIGVRRRRFRRFHRIDNGETTVFQIAASNGVKLLADDDRIEIVVVTAQSITELTEEKLTIGVAVLDVDAIVSRDIRIRFDETTFSFDVLRDRIEENHTESNNSFDQQRRETLILTWTDRVDLSRARLSRCRQLWNRERSRIFRFWRKTVERWRISLACLFEVKNRNDQAAFIKCGRGRVIDPKSLDLFWLAQCGWPLTNIIHLMTKTTTMMMMKRRNPCCSSATSKTSSECA